MITQRYRLLVQSLLLASAALLASGCAGFIKAPLLGSPADTGLVIIDAQAEMTGLFGGTSLAVAESATITRPADNVSIELTAADRGLVVFSNLKPGDYRLTRVTAQFGDSERNIPIPEDQQQEFAFTVEAGKPVYLGKVNARGSFKLTEFGESEYTLIESEQYRQRALNRVVELYPDSEWTPLLRERLAKAE